MFGAANGSKVTATNDNSILANVVATLLTHNCSHGGTYLINVCLRKLTNSVTTRHANGRDLVTDSVVSDLPRTFGGLRGWCVGRVLSALVLTTLATLPISTNDGGRTSKLICCLPGATIHVRILIRGAAARPKRLGSCSSLCFGASTPRMAAASCHVINIGFNATTIHSRGRHCIIGVSGGRDILGISYSIGNILHTVGAGTPGTGRRPTFAPTPGTRPLGPHSCVDRSVLTTNGLPGVTRLITRRVCSIHSSQGVLSHNRTSFVPGSNRRLHLVCSRLGHRRHTLVRLFRKAAAMSAARCIVDVIPRGRAGHIITFHFSGGFKLAATSSLSNRPCCVSIASRGRATSPPTMRRVTGGRGSRVRLTMYLPKGVDIALSGTGGGVKRCSV